MNETETKKKKEKRIISLKAALIIYLVLIIVILLLILQIGTAKQEAMKHYEQQLKACSNYIDQKGWTNQMPLNNIGGIINYGNKTNNQNP